MTAQRRGSLIVDLWLAAEGTVVDLLSDKRATAAANGLDLSGVAITVVAWIAYWRRKGREGAVERVGPT